MEEIQNLGKMWPKLNKNKQLKKKWTKLKKPVEIEKWNKSPDRKENKSPNRIWKVNERKKAIPKTMM